MIFFMFVSLKDDWASLQILSRASEKWLFLKWFHFLLSELVKGLRYSGSSKFHRNASIFLISYPLYFNSFLKVCKIILIPMGNKPAFSIISVAKSLAIYVIFLSISSSKTPRNDLSISYNRTDFIGCLVSLVFNSSSSIKEDYTPDLSWKLFILLLMLWRRTGTMLKTLLLFI